MEPWNEINLFQNVQGYFNRFLERNYNYGWVLYKENTILGLALGSIIPTTRGDYCRIEDFCIIPSYQLKGYGSQFINFISDELKKYNVNSIILNTIKGFPSHKFYIKNEFKEIDSSVMLLKEFD